MARVVLLLVNEKEAVAIGSAAAQQLANLGVTSVSVLRDAATTAVVLDGWAFDPVRFAEAAARLIATDASTVRILRPVVESELHPSFATSTTIAERRQP